MRSPTELRALPATIAARETERRRVPASRRRSPDRGPTPPSPDRPADESGLSVAPRPRATQATGPIEAGPRGRWATLRRHGLPDRRPGARHTAVRDGGAVGLHGLPELGVRALVPAGAGVRLPS